MKHTHKTRTFAMVGLTLALVLFLPAPSVKSEALSDTGGDDPASGLLENIPLQIGVGGIFVVLVLKEVLAFVASQGKDKEAGKPGGCSNSAECQATIRRIASQIGELHDWHSMRDPNTGVFVWYGNLATRELKDAISALAETSRAQTEVLKEILRTSQETDRLVKEQLRDQRR